MPVPSTRQQLKDYMLRQLGHPVIRINIDDSQVEDCIDDSISFMQDYHIDFSEKQYIAHKLTQPEIDAKSIVIDPNILSILGIWKLGGAGTGSSEQLFNVEYQLRSSDLFSLGATNLSGYVISQQFLALVNETLNEMPRSRYRRYDGKLYLDVSESELAIDNYIIMECWLAFDGTSHPRIYSDRVFRQLATAHARRIWGRNMSKFQGVQLPGGVTLNGGEIEQQGQGDIDRIETEFINKYMEPESAWIG